MAGKGSEIGTSLEQLAQILSRLDHPERFGICFDTCHTNDAGYVLQDFDAVLDQFDRVIGLDRLKVIHLNDSLNVRGSHKDRHANLGLGTIGFDVLYKIASNPRTEKAAKILETPWMDGKPPYLYEIAMALIASYHLTSGVLRILNNHRRLSMDQLSANPEHQAYFSGIARHRSGLIIISGPTSSGKTTTLYTILDSVKGKKIFTLEDPVEVYSDKYVQLQVNEKQHMGYADGIKQLMRHDADTAGPGCHCDADAGLHAQHCRIMQADKL